MQCYHIIIFVVKHCIKRGTKLKVANYYVLYIKAQIKYVNNFSITQKWLDIS